MKSIALPTLFTVMTTMSLQANVSISSASYQKQTKINEAGEKVTTWVKAQKVVPGTTIRYVNSLENSGNEEATKLVVNNPIPENMEYVANTASCQAGCEISYSVDGGVTFNQPSELFVGVNQERHIAKASEYTNIRWIVDSLTATSQSSVEYQARLK